MQKPSSNDKSARAYSEQFDALWYADKRTDAEELLREAQTFFPKSHEVSVKWARLATMQRNYEVAGRRWLEVLQEHPGIQECYVMGGFCLAQGGEVAAALSILQAGMSALPGVIDIWLQYIELAISNHETTAAKTVWVENYSMFQDDYRAPLIGAQIAYINEDFSAAKSLVDVSLALSNGEVSESHSALLKKLNKAEMKAIVMRFESLGGRMEGCEFGLFQRDYGAEPLGLLRWTDMAPDSLIDALEHNFAGVGEPEFTTLSSPHIAGADWTTQNAKYGMNMHTFQYDQPTEETRSRMFNSACRRLQYLREKLLADLEAGDKVFVYKVTYEVLDEAKLNRLYCAIQKIGPSTLLYVRQPDGEHPAGTVEWKRPGLMIGYIGQFSYGFGHGATLIGRAHEHWETVVRRAHELWINGFDDCAASNQ